MTVTENALPNAGTNGTPTVCSNDAAVALSTGLEAHRLPDDHGLLAVLRMG
ncbi:MAG: hypothetical protein R2818_05390 [Flavobacteriales bacterium]